MHTVLNLAHSIVRRRVASAGIRGLATGLGQGHDGIAASVIIATRNKASYLNLTLASLARQTFPLDAWQVVVVDDGSADGTDEVLDEYQKCASLPLVKHRLIRSCGVVEARNCALKAAYGRVVIFLGEDQIVSPDFLVRHLIHHTKGPCVVLGDSHRRIHTHLFSPLVPVLEGTSPSCVFKAEELMDQPQHLKNLTFEGGDNPRLALENLARRNMQNQLIWAFFNASNVSVPRQQIETIGGFDERFSDWGIADEDAAYQLHQSGVAFYFDPQAHSLHQLSSRKDVEEVDIARDLRHFFYKHPDLNADDIEPLLLRKHFSFA